MSGERLSFALRGVRWVMKALVWSSLARARVMTKFPLAVLGLVRKTGFMVPFAV